MKDTFRLKIYLGMMTKRWVGIDTYSKRGWDISNGKEFDDI